MWEVSLDKLGLYLLCAFLLELWYNFINEVFFIEKLYVHFVKYHVNNQQFHQVVNMKLQNTSNHSIDLVIFWGYNSTQMLFNTVKPIQ